MGFGSGRV
jgi:ketosteroid isomerase-like protein